MKTKTTTTHAIDALFFHHLPNETRVETLISGATIRDLLKYLRSIDYGNIGGSHIIELSDNSFVEVELTPAGGGEWIMNSQRIRRSDADGTIRYYKI